MDEILYLLNNLLNIAAQATKLWGNCNHAYVQMLWAFAEDRRGTGYAVSTKPRNLDAKHVRSQISETHSYSAMMSRAHQKRKGRPSAHLKSFQIFATWDGERLDSTSTSRPSCLNLKKRLLNETPDLTSIQHYNTSREKLYFQCLSYAKRTDKITELMIVTHARMRGFVYR